MLHLRMGCLLLLLLLTGCGFHLQGAWTLAPPLHRIYLQTPDPYGYLAVSLKQFLKTSHVNLVDAPQLASTSLVILRDANSQNLVGVSATQQTRQYDLHVTATFQVLDKSGRVLVPDQTLVETRTITVQSNQILGSSNEANMLFLQMRRTLAYAIMNRLASTEITQILAAGNEIKSLPT